MEFDAVRAALRRERERRVGPRVKLEELSGVNESTIYKIETKWIDPRTKRPYVPGADQVLRLISALPGLTVSQFFSAIEGIDGKKDLGTDQQSQGGIQHGGRGVSTSDGALSQQLAAICLDAAEHTRRTTTRGLLIELAYVFTELGRQTPADRADQPRGAAGDSRLRGSRAE